MTNKHCVLLFSGGLDSLIAARVLTDQNITVSALHLILPFEIPGENRQCEIVAARAREAEIELRQIHCGRDYLDMLRHPRHGYGKNMNPCIDCKIYFLKAAAQYMRDIGASFIASGEVSGQRPMSQRRDMIIHIERAAGLEGKVLRPLSAGFFPPTDAEISGLVDRSRLLSLHGRGRTPQLELAQHYQIQDYSSPAGGCALTDPNFARRLDELFSHTENIRESDVYLLRIGRHFRIGKIKLILSRNAAETELLYRLSDHADYFIEPNARGPVAFICGKADEDEIRKSIDTLASFCKAVTGDSFSSTVTTKLGASLYAIQHSGTRAAPI